MNKKESIRPIGIIERIVDDVISDIDCDRKKLVDGIIAHADTIIESGIYKEMYMKLNEYDYTHVYTDAVNAYIDEQIAISADTPDQIAMPTEQLNEIRNRIIKKVQEGIIIRVPKEFQHEGPEPQEGLNREMNVYSRSPEGNRHL